MVLPDVSRVEVDDVDSDRDRSSDEKAVNEGKRERGGQTRRVTFEQEQIRGRAKKDKFAVEPDEKDRKLTART